MGEKSRVINRTTKFKDLYQKYYKGKRSPLLDYHETEVIISGLLMLLFLILIYLYGSKNSVEDVTESVKVIVSGLAFAMIGLLGFIITGLSVLLGTTSKSFFIVLIKKKLNIDFEKILFSFYYLGFIVGIIILSSVFIYFVISLELPLIFPVFIVVSCIYFYLFTFSIFYAISLLGVCLIFFITKLNVEVASEYEKEREIMLNNIFQKMQVEALCKITFNEQKSEEFFVAMKEMLETDYSDYKDELRKKMIEYYKLDE